MIRKLWDVVSIVAVAHLLAILALVAVLASSGSLKPDRLKNARDALAGKTPPTTMPAESAKPAEPPAPASAGGQPGQMIVREQTKTQIAQLQVDQQTRVLKNLQTQMELIRGNLDARIARFEQEKKDWQASRDADRAAAASEGFRKSLALYESMKPDQVKDQMMTMDDAEAVRLLSAMDERKLAKVVTAFTGSEVEKAKLAKIIQRMKDPGSQDQPKAAAPAQVADKTGPAAGASSNGSGAGQPGSQSPAGGPVAQPKSSLPTSGTP